MIYPSCWLPGEGAACGRFLSVSYHLRVINYHILCLVKARLAVDVCLSNSAWALDGASCALAWSWQKF
jgi:hypothetical protein